LKTPIPCQADLHSDSEQQHTRDREMRDAGGGSGRGARHGWGGNGCLIAKI
jgi:hypothetical protein